MSLFESELLQILGNFVSISIGIHGQVQRTMEEYVLQNLEELNRVLESNAGGFVDSYSRRFMVACARFSIFCVCQGRFLSEPFRFFCFKLIVAFYRREKLFLVPCSVCVRIMNSVYFKPWTNGNLGA
jgi:hypothetical protein